MNCLNNREAAMEDTIHKFRIAILPYTVALTTFGALCILVVCMAFFIADLSRLSALYAVEGTFYFFLWIAFLMICCFVASSLTALSKVTISLDGITGSTFWGIKSTFVPWDDIDRVKPISLFGTRWLRLFGKSLKRPLWIPLFLKNMSEFQKHVMHCSKEGNPIRKYIDESNTYPYPGLGKNIVILITYLLVPLLLCAGTAFYYLKKAPIDELVFDSSLSDKLFGVIPVSPLPASFYRFYIRNYSDFDSHKRYEYGQSLLHVTLGPGYIVEDFDQWLPHVLNLAEFFLQKGVDINALDERGFAALHEAVALDSPELIGLLLRHGADINVRSKGKGSTPLGLAKLIKKKGGTVKPEVIQLLIQNGAIE